MPLCLTLKTGDSVYIGEEVKIQLIHVKKQANHATSPGYVKILFYAPKDTVINREKLVKQMIDEYEEE